MASTDRGGGGAGQAMMVEVGWRWLDPDEITKPGDVVCHKVPVEYKTGGFPAGWINYPIRRMLTRSGLIARLTRLEREHLKYETALLMIAAGYKDPKGFAHAALSKGGKP